MYTHAGQGKCILAEPLKPQQYSRRGQVPVHVLQEEVEVGEENALIVGVVEAERLQQLVRALRGEETISDKGEGQWGLLVVSTTCHVAEHM